MSDPAIYFKSQFAAPTKLLIDDSDKNVQLYDFRKTDLANLHDPQ